MPVTKGLDANKSSKGNAFTVYIKFSGSTAILGLAPLHVGRCSTWHTCCGEAFIWFITGFWTFIHHLINQPSPLLTIASKTTQTPICIYITGNWPRHCRWPGTQPVAQPSNRAQHAAATMYPRRLDALHSLEPLLNSLPCVSNGLS
jgi:hypothetical protein